MEFLVGVVDVWKGLLVVVFGWLLVVGGVL